MNSFTRVIQISGVFVLWLFSSVAALAQDTTPPDITAFSLSPTSISTTAAPATVSLNITLSDAGSGVFYVETALVDPSGIFGQRVSKLYSPPKASVTDTLTFQFPQFSTPGAWKVGFVFVADAAGNTLILDSNGLAARGFGTTIQVTSTVDTTAPSLRSFSFTPATIDTTATPATVTVNFGLSDDLSGANYFQAVFASPSGNQVQTASSKVTPATTVTGSTTVTFPQFSEAGIWTVTSVFVVDAVGNTSELNTSALTQGGFPTTLTVTSPSDTTAPVLATFSVTPATLNVTSAPATVTLNFKVTDDLSGATSFQAQLLSPSGTTVQSGSANFAASTSFTGSASITFPKGSENGVWSISSIFLADAAGNTRIFGPADLAGAGFPNSLTVTNGAGDTTPPVITPTVSPAPNAFGWNTTTPVTISWSVTDPESGIASSSGCGTTTLSAETSGTAFTCSATNGAGLTNSASVTVKIDLTAPIVTPSVTPAPNSAGWNNSSVTVNWNLSDPVSGINADASTCDAVTLTAETPGTVVSCTAVNGAGLTQSASVTVKIDMTPPTTAAVASPAPNATGWNTTNVTVTFTGSDSLSGIASCTAPVTLSAEGTGFSATGTCMDNAGNVSAPATAGGIKIDKTPPVIVPAVIPAPNAAGWNNSDATVNWSVADSVSGIASSTGCTPTTVSTETTGLILTCSATNGAGLSSSVSVTIKLDKTAPVASNTTATPNPIALGSGTTLTATISDLGGSNVASAEFSVDGGRFSPMTGTFGGATANVSATLPAFTTTGLHDLCVRGSDIAGNVGATDCIVIAIFDPNGGFVSAGGGSSSPAGAYLTKPSAAGPVTFGFNVKYLPNNSTTPVGDFEFHFPAGNLDFKGTGFDFLVVTSEPRAQFQGTGTLNGNTTCKFAVDAWDTSFQPGNTDAFGLRIFDCGTTPGDVYNLATAPTTKGKIQIHQ